MLGEISQVLSLGGGWYDIQGSFFLNPTMMSGYEGRFSLFEICHLNVSPVNNYARRDKSGFRFGRGMV